MYGSCIWREQTIWFMTIIVWFNKMRSFNLPLWKLLYPLAWCSINSVPYSEVLLQAYRKFSQEKKNMYHAVVCTISSYYYINDYISRFSLIHLNGMEGRRELCLIQFYLKMWLSCLVKEFWKPVLWLFQWVSFQIWISIFAFVRFWFCPILSHHISILHNFLNRDLWRSRRSLKTVEGFDHSVVNETLGACGELPPLQDGPCLPYFVWQGGEIKVMTL